jgi:two-component system, NarL family, sensor kinase
MYKLKIKLIWLISLGSSCCSVAFAQTLTEMEGGFEKRKTTAITNLKNHSKNDTARVNALQKVIACGAFFLKQKKELMPYCEEELALSRKLQYSKGIIMCHYWLGEFHKSGKNINQANQYFDSAINLSNTQSDTSVNIYKALAQYGKGRILKEQENYYACLNYYFEALKYFGNKKSSYTESLYSEVSRIYRSINNYDKALEYEKRVLDICRNDSDKEKIADEYVSLANIYLEKKEIKTSKLYLDSFKLYLNVIEPYFLASYYNAMANLFYESNQYDSAFHYYKLTLPYDEENGHIFQIKNMLYNLSNTALKLGRLQEAKMYAEKNLQLVSNVDSKFGTIGALQNLAEYYNRIGNNLKAYELLSKSVILNDSLITEKSIEQNNKLAALFENEKSQKEIIKLQLEKNQKEATIKEKAATNKILIGSIAALNFLSFLGYRNLKAKRKLQQQKITELEKDKQLSAIDAMLQGQEEERSRIAKDLHDGLGGMLSGTKLSFINMKENLVLTPENATQFDKSLSMLDNTIADLRKVAHNLMPEALVKFGLQEAVKDFCNGIQSSTNIKVVYQPLGENKKLPNTAEVFTYRIVQELVNNAVKHANATQIIVQLATNNNKVGITVEDNGKGYDINALANSKGAGMDNIKYRVQYFNGTIDTVTSVGNGTSVNIELVV